MKPDCISSNILSLQNLNKLSEGEYIQKVTMHRYELAVLKAVESKSATIEEIAEKAGISMDAVLWAVEGLKKEGLVEVTKVESEKAEISSEGARYTSEGLPEERLLERIVSSKVKVGSLNDEERIGLQWAKKKGYLTIESGVLKITAKGKDAGKMKDPDREALESLKGNGGEIAELGKGREQQISNLKARKLISVKKKEIVAEVSITGKGLKKLKETGEDESIRSLDKGMITKGTWKGRKFSEYDVEVDVDREEVAVRHPLRNLMNEIRAAYLGLGFSEVSGPIIEPAFRVFDALFMPQDHPARDVQDTFYLKHPSSIPIADKEYMERVKKEHTSAWKQEWSEAEAERAVLRTHATSVSGRYVNEIAKGLKNGKDYQFPLKLFSIGRVFRNENIDYKHLTDYYNIDGIIIGKRLMLSHLFSTMIDFFGAMGIEVKFKPAYFPFVEPGVEMYGYSEVANEWIEIGGSGILRSQVTGIDRRSVNVLAWGIGMERILLMKKGNIESITELYGNSIGWLRKARL